MRAFRRKSGAAQGFTLLEVMVALVVIATAFTALLGLHVRNIRLAAREQAYTQALLLARSMVTEIQLQLDGFPEVGIAEGDFEEDFPGTYPGYRWMRIVEIPPVPIPDTRQVTIRVVPNEDESAAAELTLFVRPGST